MDRAARCRSAAPGHVGVQGEPIPDRKETAARIVIANPATNTRMKAVNRLTSFQDIATDLNRLCLKPPQQRHEGR